MAIIGVSGVLGTALIANWGKIFGGEPPRAEAVKQEQDKFGAAPPAGSAENLSNAQRPAVNAGTMAVDDAASKIESAGIPNVDGDWKDQFGQYYRYRQSGAEYRYDWYANGEHAGSGSGRLDGPKFAGTFQYDNGTAGSCAGEVEGNRVDAKCDVSGKEFPILLTR